MYSRIPMPKVEWKEENRRYALCFFPLVGAVTGGLLLLWKYICVSLNIGIIVNSAVCVLIPVLVTGGIHIDGFCDTTDALCSYSEKKKKLEIMSDPHIGSFAVISLCCMFLLQFALFCEVRGHYVIAAGYVLSRALSGIAAVGLRSAKSEGALQSFVKPAHRKITLAVLAVTTLLCAAGMCVVDPIQGAAVCAVCALLFLIYRACAYKNFGGITGDTEGWFLQLTETAILVVVFMAEKAVMFL